MLFSFLRSLLRENGGSLRFPRCSYRDLSVFSRSIICVSLRLRQIIDLLATDKSRYCAQPLPIIVKYFELLFEIFIFHTLSVSCSHSRATQYFIASVTGSCSYAAYPCDSYTSFKRGRCRACKGACSSMGFDADRTKRTGKFYIKTNRKSPFCGKFSSQKLK